MKKILLPISILINAALLLIIILLIPSLNTKKDFISSTDKPENYPYLSKRIFVEEQNDILINFVPLRTAMNKYILKQPEKIGVYFEYLPSGNSIGINDKTELRLASLIKIPVVMATYRQIELGKINENTILTVTENDLNEGFGVLWKKGAGTKITVEEAIRLSLIESDNTAANTLNSHLPQGAIDGVFDTLDIPKDTKNNLPVISPKNYSSILRSLYLSSFLTRDNSNEILEILTETNFNDKIATIVDEDVKVSHKIGVYESEGVYSDCGIIYAPNRPYILCIMVNSTEDKAKQHMQYISRMIYGYLTKVSK